MNIIRLKATLVSDKNKVRSCPAETTYLIMAATSSGWVYLLNVRDKHAATKEAGRCKAAAIIEVELPEAELLLS